MHGMHFLFCRTVAGSLVQPWWHAVLACSGRMVVQALPSDEFLRSHVGMLLGPTAVLQAAEELLQAQHIQWHVGWGIIERSVAWVDVGINGWSVDAGINGWSGGWMEAAEMSQDTHIVYHNTSYTGPHGCTVGMRACSACGPGAHRGAVLGLRAGGAPRSAVLGLRAGGAAFMQPGGQPPRSTRRHAWPWSLTRMPFLSRRDAPKRLARVLAWCSMGCAGLKWDGLGRGGTTMEQ